VVRQGAQSRVDGFLWDPGKPPVQSLFGIVDAKRGLGEIMASDKQIRANRRNARKSTGPKSPEGKAVVGLNALKHGLLSRQVLLPNEDEASLLQLGERLHSQLQPVGELEGLLVERIVAAAWRLRRVLAVETRIYERVYERERFSYAGEEGSLGLAFMQNASTYSTLSRYETTIERGLFKALHELQRLQAARRAEADVLPPPAVDVDVNVSGVSKEDF
jgi:hypothetical protein